MAGKRNYGGVIWTDHALERLGQRGFTQKLAWQAFQYPDSEKEGKSLGSKEYRKQVGESTVTIIAKQNEKKEWVILSAWVYPSLTAWAQNKDDEYKKYKKVGFWGKFWYTLKGQLFG